MRWATYKIAGYRKLYPAERGTKNVAYLTRYLRLLLSKPCVSFLAS